MSTRALILWIVVQTALGLWLGSLLVAGAPDTAGPASASRRSQPDPPRAELSVGGDRRGDEPVEEDLVLRSPPADGAGAPEAALLFGLVTDAADVPVAGASVFARPADGPPMGTETTASGAWSLPLAPGRLDLAVRCRGFAEYSEPLDLVVGPQRHDVVLEHSTVLPVFARTSDGDPLEQALRAAGVDERIRLSAVATRHAPEGFPLLEDFVRLGIGKFRSARWLGQVQIEGAPPEQIGELQLDRGLPAFVSLTIGPAIVATQLAERGQERVDFTVVLADALARFGGIRLQLLSETTGQPLAGIRVEGPGVDLTGADGVAEFTRVVAGLHRITVEGSEVSWRQLVRVAPGENVDLGRVPIDEPQKVHGIVVDAAGAPARAAIRWDDLDRWTFPQPLDDSISTGSNAEGRWSVSLPPRRHAIHAHLLDGSQATHVIVDSPATGELRLQLRPTIEVELIKDFDVDRVYLLSVRTRDGVPCFGNFVRAGFEQSLRLPAGDYLADVHDGLTLVRSFTFTVGGDVTRIRVP